MAGVRSQDLTGIHRGAEVATPARGANVAGASGDLTGLRRGADTAGQLEALRDATRGAEADAQREVRSFSRVPEPGDTASVHEASALDIVADIRSEATVPAMDAPVLHSTVSPRQPPPGVKLGLLGGADRPPRSSTSESGFPVLYRRLRDILERFDHSSRTDIANDVRRAIDRIRRKAVHELEKCNRRVKNPALGAPDTFMAEEAYRVLEEMAQEADWGSDLVCAGQFHDALKYIDHATSREWDRLTMTYGALDALSTRTMQRPRATGAPPVAAPSTTMPLIERLPVSGPAHPIVAQVDPAFTEPAGGLVHATDVPGPPPASSLPGPSLSEGTGAEAGGLGRGWLEPPTTTTGATPAHPAASETIVTPTPAGTSSFWLQPFDPVPAPGTVPFGSGPHHAGETAQPSGLGRGRGWLEPPATTTGATPAHPAASETIVTPSLAGTSSFWLQPFDPVPAPGTVPFGSGPHHAGETAQPSGLGRGWLEPPATTTTTGATPAHPAASGTIVTLSLAGTSSFRLQPFEPLAVPGTVPLDPGLHPAGMAVQPPPVTTTASSTAPAPRARFRVPSRVDDDFDVERALLAGELPPGFDASRLIVHAGTFTESGLADELAAGRLPIQAIDTWIQRIRAAEERGLNLVLVVQLECLKESIKRALRDAYPRRVRRQWLARVRAHLHRLGELPTPNAASATRAVEFDVTEIARLLGTDEDAARPARLRPPAVPGHNGAGAGAPPPAADPWRIRSPGMGGGPRPVAFDPRPAPPGPGSQVVATGTIRTPAMSTGAPPGWQSAGTPGFARAASGAVELPFSYRAAIADQLRNDDALLEAEYALRTGGADPIGWTPRQWQAVLADLYRINAIAEVGTAADAARLDLDWSAIEALARILDFPPPLP